jgi:hypothetical protein
MADAGDHVALAAALAGCTASGGGASGGGRPMAARATRRHREAPLRVGLLARRAAGERLGLYGPAAPAARRPTSGGRQAAGRVVGQVQEAFA